LQRVKESVNLDQLIAEEDAFLTTQVKTKKVKKQDGVEQQIEIAYQHFQSQRKNSKRLKKQ